MSGTKCSRVTLNRMAETLLRAKREKDTTLKKMDELSGRMSALVSKIQNVTADAAAIAHRIAEFKKLLNEESPKIKEKQGELEGIHLPESIQGVSEDQINAYHQKILQIRNEGQRVDNLFDKMDMDIINLTTADKTLSNVEFTMQKFQHQAEANEALLKKWMQGEHNKLTQDYGVFQKNLTQYKNTMQSQKDAVHISRHFKEAEGRLDSFNKRLAELTQESNRREDMHQKRLYILKGLREVCASLGFSEVSEPTYKEKGNHNSPVMQSFNTVNEGEVAFTIHLDNRIESDSGIRVEACGDEFGKLSKALEDQFGVETAFRRVGEENVPLERENTEKPLPRHETQKTNRASGK